MKAAKSALKEELLAQLLAELEVIEQAQRASSEAATHEEAKPENSKDTRAIEQGYLARGQAQRIAELRVSVAEVRAMPLRAFDDDAAIAIGALVMIEEDESTRRYFIAPHGGGATLAGGIQVITPRSPVGRALVGRRVGDSCEVMIAGRKRELGIAAIE